MKKLIIILLIPFVLSACAKQSVMNYEVFFERLNNENILTDKIITEDSVICFTSDGFVLELKHNADGDVYKILISCDDLNKSDEFILFAKEVMNVYVPKDNIDVIFDDVIKTYQSDWHTYQFFSTDNGMFLSVNSNKLNLETAPELSLKSNDKIENRRKTH